MKGIDDYENHKSDTKVFVHCKFYQERNRIITMKNTNHVNVLDVFTEKYKPMVYDTSADAVTHVWK